EGMMLVGAVMGFSAVQRLHAGAGVSLAAAVGVAALAGAAMALIHAFLVITLRASQIVSGLALTIFAGAAGLSSYLGNDLNLSSNPARDRAAVGGRGHRRRGLDRDGARHLRRLAAGALSRRRLLLRRAPGARAAAPGARDPRRADGALDERPPVRDDCRRARARLGEW